MNADPIQSGQDGADEPPTLIKEDLLSSGAIRRSTSDTQVDIPKTKSLIISLFHMSEVYYAVCNQSPASSVEVTYLICFFFNLTGGTG